MRKDIKSREGSPGALPGELEVTDLQLSEVPFGSFASQSALLRLSTFFTLDGEEAVTYVDLIGVRVANVIGGLSVVAAFGVAPDETLTEEVAATVETHAADAAASLR